MHYFLRSPLLAVLVTAGLFTAAPVRAQWVSQRAPAGLFNLTDVHFTDADHGYASAAVGGLIKTIDGGATWRDVPTGVSSSLRDVYFVTPDTGYVVGNTAVIIGTTDGGQNWTRHDLANSGQSVNGVYFHDGHHGLVTQGDQIWQTTDGGLTWTSVYTYAGPLAIFTFRFLEFPSDSVGYGVGGFSGSFGNVSQVVKTIDGGQTWQLLPSTAGSVPMGGASAAAFPDSLTGYVADVQDRLFRTTDGGQSWTIVAQSTFGAFYGMSFTDALTGYGVGFNGNLRSTTDGGQTWQNQSLNTADSYDAVYFPTPQTGYAVGSIGGTSNPAILKYTAPVGLPEPMSSSSIRAYPNPASDLVHLSNLPSDAPVQAAIYSLDGRRLRSVALPRGTAGQLPTRGLASGLYVLRLDVNGRAYQQKLVIE